MQPVHIDNGLRVVFAGTPDFAAVHLKALIAADINVCAVYTQPDRPAGRGKKLTHSPVKTLGQEYQLPVFQPQSLKDPDSQAEFATLRPDVFIVVAYGLLIPQAVLGTPTFGCINVHASLLPRWRGAAPIQRAIEAGDKETGVTIMQMDEGLDTGDMLNKVVCPIEDEETGGSLHDKLASLGPSALLQTLNDMADGRLQPASQDDNCSTYARKISKQEAAIDWFQSAEVIDRKIRAFNPFPVAFSILGDKTIRIWSAKPLPKQDEVHPGSSPGTIVSSDKTSVVVACGEGQLEITTAQLPGKKPLPVAEIMRGNADLFTEDSRFCPPQHQESN